MKKTKRPKLDPNPPRDSPSQDERLNLSAIELAWRALRSIFLRDELADVRKRGVRINILKE